ncbi:MAG: IS1-like element transposase [Cyanobacteria bacterium P01_E01_bin.34]
MRDCWNYGVCPVKLSMRISVVFQLCGKWMEAEKSSCERSLSMVQEPAECPICGQTDVVGHGYSGEDKQRYRCRHGNCSRQTFIRHYDYWGSLPEVKQQIADMAMNGSGIRDTARVLRISSTTVIKPLKKHRHLQQVNTSLLESMEPLEEPVMLVRVEEAELR